MSVQNIKINPMYVYIGKDTAQQQTITCKADVTGASLGGKYFVFHDPAGAKRYAWFDTGSLALQLIQHLLADGLATP